MNLSNVFKNRTVVGLICIALSLIICFGLTPLFNGAVKAQSEIIRVTKDIKRGEAVTTDNTEKVKVGSFNLPDNVVKEIEELTSKFVTADLMKGDFVLVSKLTDKPYEENEYLYKLNGKKEAISISIKSFALGLSGKLKSGDIVKIIASDYGEMRQTLIPPELQYVEVLAVTTAEGADESTQDSNDSNDEENQLPSTVTLLANNTQAKTLAELEAKSKIHIALVYRGDESTAEKFLDAQDELLKKQESGPSETIILQSDQSQNLAPSSTQSPFTSSVQGGQIDAQ